MLTKLILIFIGGGSGAILRFLISIITPKAILTHPFPLATLIVNLVGSFLLGLITAAAAKNLISNDLRLLLGVGLCGGFTTFSTFSIESLNLLRNEQYIIFTIYITLSIALGIILALLAYKLIQ